mmetsp:Transcript_13907/g.41309  ORF Transcript_13907/g.41309 Transcript_13907/m.41309 type:complete len:287 (-) Transcript_13907:890-1750(-)
MPSHGCCASCRFYPNEDEGASTKKGLAALFNCVRGRRKNHIKLLLDSLGISLKVHGPGGYTLYAATRNVRNNKEEIRATFEIIWADKHDKKATDEEAKATVGPSEPEQLNKYKIEKSLERLQLRQQGIMSGKARTEAKLNEACKDIDTTKGELNKAKRLAGVHSHWRLKSEGALQVAFGIGMKQQEPVYAEDSHVVATRRDSDSDVSPAQSNTESDAGKKQNPRIPFCRANLGEKAKQGQCVQDDGECRRWIGFDSIKLALQLFSAWADILHGGAGSAHLHGIAQR